jgi:hypothetical protein
MKEKIGQHVVAQVNELIKSGKAIVFGSDIPDNEYSEINWSQYGLIDTNEIVVIVRCGGKAFAARDQSRLVIPAMDDRVYGMDSSDEALAFELGEKLWRVFSDELIKEVHHMRKAFR